ncbi:unnamed protein product [Sphenostylis stenocarpa]|uniref:Uncharacterized protein n=1 Tax=Sphenostylis stenocarpa TaxID=92480 RepID=A0AA86VXL8_9FABA|nr:unnamed protein product [Sphenostylis stenocarpa]
MGASLCVLCHLISDQNNKSCARDDNNLKKKKKEGRFCKILKRKMEMEREEKKAQNLTLEDWILASPGLKPDYIISSGEVSFSSKHSKKKVHPCGSQCRGSLIAETKDSLCLNRPVNHHEEGGEEMLSSTSLMVKSKRVRFKLPHIVICYSPDEPCLSEEAYYSSENEESFYSSICSEYSIDSSGGEPFFRLAVDTLPHVSVSSKI